MSSLPLLRWTSELDPKSFLRGRSCKLPWCSRFCHPAPGTRDLQAQGVQPCYSVHILLQVKSEDHNHFSAHTLEALLMKRRNSMGSLEVEDCRSLHCFMICMVLDSLQLSSRCMCIDAWNESFARTTHRSALFSLTDKQIFPHVGMGSGG
jgi:hypothetical protein